MMSKPIIKSVNLSDYHGQVGERIQIRAEQYIGLASVNVELFGMEGTLLENGRSFEAATRTGLWVYMGQTNIPAGTEITIRTQVMTPGMRDAIALPRGMIREPYLDIVGQTRHQGGSRRPREPGAPREARERLRHADAVGRR